MFTSADHGFMSRALELAAQGLYTTTPNPRVGCVIVRDGVIVGEGWHRRAGEPHAEALALAEAGGRSRGATVYVTLEPCSHLGRTPPCVESLVSARVARVIAAMEDPNPRVNGQGLARLRDAGIDVRCGLLQHEATELNIGFVSRMIRGRPWIRLKVAASLDGMTALHDGSSRWITGEAARRDGHAWRARACAVLTGIGTVRDDDPRLDVRDVPTQRQPLRILVDSRLDVAPDAKLFDADGGTLIAYAAGNADKERALAARGCELLHRPGPDGKVDLPGLFAELGARGLNEVHVEAGHKLNGSLVREGCVDELLVYLAPALIGAGRGMFELPQIAELSARRQLRFTEVDRIGSDLRLRARF
ncbi:MAG TPA: bifunctional diaminohydroxyphosphoribosylaminopyrimidine deaminase/5-amino-6-(5-phosphoribosylamino)uracil reductase RibD [Burkholderiaceae bacterium]|nr:bifunctional diaminohydroxyphosphoribosylaminopyrimidine deaminase/5-amino-6-(5-phosphoribosylamino)uracil reductase RibD [Burkholderiaceae bacterium]